MVVLFCFQNNLLENHTKLRLNSKSETGAVWSFRSVFRTRSFQGTGRKTAMDVLKMLADLRQEREQIEEAIMTLERLARGRGRRRGRPPAWMSAIKRRGRPPGSKNKVKESAAA
jgi:hypothetical protein